MQSSRKIRLWVLWNGVWALFLLAVVLYVARDSGPSAAERDAAWRGAFEGGDPREVESTARRARPRTPLVLGVLLPELAPVWNRTRVVCTLCAAREVRISIGGWVIERQRQASQEEVWWSSLVRASHAHEWMQVGCSPSRRLLTGDAWVSCAFPETSMFLWTLPRFWNQGLAGRVAERLVALDPRERRSALLASGGLAYLDALIEPEESDRIRISPERQEQRYVEWREDNRRWHDLFPPRLADLEAGD